MSGGGAWLIAFIVVQRIAELFYARRNAAQLIARGGMEFGGADYPFMVALHVAWLAGLFAFGRDQPVNLWWLAVFVLLQAGRAWVLLSLGAHWTTRVIVLPGHPLVRHGLYRVLRHPNYLVVALEVAVAPLALGLPVLAAVFALLNAAVLARRIRVENAALAGTAGRR